VFASGSDKSVRVWDRETGKELAALAPHKGEAYAVAVSADGKRVATAGKDRVVRLYPNGK
jgi:WD40 repeat protein